MEMSGHQLIPASKEEVWAALNDAEVLKVCIPGCQELIKASETEMSAVAVMKVGPVKARFQGAVTLSDLDPPHGYKISGEGQGGVAGFAKGIATVRLETVDGGTSLSYVVDAQIGGKLSQLGSRLIDVTAKQMAGQFFKRFAEEVNFRKTPVIDGGLQGGAKPTLTQQRHEPSTSSPPLGDAFSSRSSIAPAQNRSGSGASLPLMAIVVFVSVLSAMWTAYAVLFPALGLEENGPGILSTELAGVVQLIMAAAIGYLFGARSR